MSVRGVRSVDGTGTYERALTKCAEHLQMWLLTTKESIVALHVMGCLAASVP